MRIRPAISADASFLGPIQLSAGALFRSLPDVAWIADEPVGEADEYLPLIADGTVWVAEDAGVLVGVLLATVFDEAPDALHILEIAVAREAQRRGIGRGLLDAALEHARDAGLQALTLTTFRHVAWNRPFYARYGFAELSADEMSARVRGIIRAETERGLPNRCAMRIEVA